MAPVTEIPSPKFHRNSVWRKGPGVGLKPKHIELQEIHWQPEHKAKSPEDDRGFCNLIRRRPTLPHRCQCSTIGAGGLNFRVRDGNGCDPSARVTGNSYKSVFNQANCGSQMIHDTSRISSRANFMVKPHDRLVLVSFTRYRASTPSLSPGSLPGVFSHPKGWGYLILRWVSRLYAFSVYPVRT